MKHLSYLIFALLLTSCYKQERQCKDFKTGTFLFEQEINGEKHTSTFERSETMEIETYNGKVDTASIRWLNDCEYVLQKLHPKNRAEQQGIHMKILTTHNNEYTFEYGLVGAVEKQKGIIKKIK